MEQWKRLCSTLEPLPIPTHFRLPTPKSFSLVRPTFATYALSRLPCRASIPTKDFHLQALRPEFNYPSNMDPIIKGAIPVLPASNTTESLNWWISVCGFKETFRDATPPRYVGISRDEASLHISEMDDKGLALTVGDQTMVRLIVNGVDALYIEYQNRGGKVHPNGALQTKPWGTKEFTVIDPNGVCVTFQE